MREIEASFARERAALDAWLDQSYAGREDERYYGENDSSYPGWDGIERLLGRVFDERLARQLSEESIDSLLFFISRSDEGGRILKWFSTGNSGGPFSNIGDLSLDDLTFLSEAALARDDDDCDHQLVASFRKCTSLTSDAFAVVCQFFDKSAEYTRRMALHALQEFEHPHTIDLAIRLWEDSDTRDDDEVEFARLSVLAALKCFPEASATFDRYLTQYVATYDIDAAPYRQVHIDRLSASAPTPE